jgi:predicted TIM-barrel fold metal-dependent hydrolase
MRNRREATAMIGLGALAAQSAAYAQSGSPPVIEWNQHMFSQDIARFPFNLKSPYTPNAAKLPSDPLPPYLQRLKAEGIAKAVFVQPEPYGDDHRLMLDCLARTPDSNFKGTSLFYPKDADAPRKLDLLVKENPRIVSTRFHAHRGKEMYLGSFADDGVRAIWKKAVDLGLIIELHIGPNYGKQVGDAIRAFPGCKVLIDHMAEAKLGTAVEYADVLDLAQLPNVYIKLSELANIGGIGPLFENILPFTRRVIKEFGPDRVVWSSGTPKIADVHMRGYSPADIAKVKGGNLRKLLNWQD